MLKIHININLICNFILSLKIIANTLIDFLYKINTSLYLCIYYKDFN